MEGDKNFLDGKNDSVRCDIVVRRRITRHVEGDALQTFAIRKANQ